MWYRTKDHDAPEFTLVHIETGNRICVYGTGMSDNLNRPLYKMVLYSYHGYIVETKRPDVDVQDLANGTRVQCEYAFELLCSSLAQIGQLST